MINLRFVFRRMLKENDGVATSLVEAAATVALGAMLATVAIAGSVDAINDSKVQAAISEVNTIAQGVVTFYKDNAFFPLFRVGGQTGPNDGFFNNLVSESGVYPADLTGTWEIPAQPLTYTSPAEAFGHEVAATDDTIEGHLLRNEVDRRSQDGGLTFAGTEAYIDQGAFPNPQQGWSGPYIGTMSKADPWGGKYLINVRKLHVRHFRDLGTNEVLPAIAVLVLSAGPNRILETAADQPGREFESEGDDIVFRIK
jgi:hypothetical protein